MSGILLTKYDGSILRPIAKLLGVIMDYIFRALNAIGIPNIGLAIILFTIVIYMLLLPLTVKQQKFAKLSAKMNPELQAIRKKYEGKKDNESLQAMNLETQEVYAKYGVSPSGSCVQLLIQMPILFALYRVIYAIPAYVQLVNNAFTELVDKLYLEGAQASEFLRGLTNSAMYSKQFDNALFVANDPVYVKNTFIDCLNRASTADWTALGDKFTNLSSEITSTFDQISVYNNFLGINVGNSPSFTIKTAFETKNYILLIGAILIPLLAAFSQWLNTKLMPQANASADGNDTMGQTMKTMNTVMPIMSAVFCLSLPAGMGIYWIAGAFIRCVQQIVINKKIDKIDIDAVIEKNKEKAKEKMAKKKEYVANLQSKANVNTRSFSAKANINNVSSDSKVDNSQVTNYNKNAKPGSLAEKANLVKQYNERNNK